MTSLGLPDTAPRTDPLSRVAEMLNGHVMGPRVRAALGAPGRAGCSVLDAKYEPGVRGTVLYGVGPLLVRGDLIDVPDGRRRGVPAGRGPRRPAVPVPGRPRPPRAGRRDRPGTAADGAGGGPARRRVAAPLPRGARAVPAGQAGDPGGRAPRAGGPGRFGPVGREELSRRPEGGGGRGRGGAARCHRRPGGAPALRTGAGARARAVARRAGARARRAPRRADAPAGRNGGARRAAGGRRARRSAPPAGGQPPDPFGRRRAGPLRHPEFPAWPRSTTEPVGPWRRLAVRLLAEADAVPRGAVGLVHGDCKPSQFLLRGEDVVLLDLDSCGAADPAVDVGTFLATLRQQAVRRALGRRAAPSSADGTTPLAGRVPRGVPAVGGRTSGRRAAAADRLVRGRRARAQGAAVLRARTPLPADARTGGRGARVPRPAEGDDMSAVRSATAGLPGDIIVPEKPSAPRVGMSDYRRGLALLRRFHGGRRPFVLGAVLLLVEAAAAVVEPIPIAYLIDYLQGNAAPLHDRGWPTFGWSDRTATLVLLVLGHHPAGGGEQRRRLPRRGLPGPRRPDARLQPPGRDVLAPAAAVVGLPRQAPHRRRPHPGHRRRPRGGGLRRRSR